MTMKAEVARWGDSLAVRLPEELVDRLGLIEGSVVSLDTAPSQLTIGRDESVPQSDLDDSLASIDRSMEQLRGGEGRPMRQAITELIDRLDGERGR